ncbi:MAG: transglutaminase-like domain-containing protein [Candidatus Micrarchaeia archaeon]
MKIKIFIFVLYFFLLFHSYESARFIFEKEWIIEGEAGMEYFFNSSFIYNGTGQNVLSMGSENGYFENSGDNIYLISNGSMNGSLQTISAYAIIEVNHSPFLTKDEPLVWFKEPENDLEKTARNLSLPSSKAKTLIKLVGWFNSELEYNLKDSGNTDPAIVYEKKSAVCNGYSNLLLYYLGYLKIENRKIYGYTFSEDWQEHVWAEAKISEEWIGIDPTFGQIGLLSSNHIKTFVSDNKNEPESKLYFTGKSTNFYSKTKIEKFSSSQLQGGIIHIATAHKRRVDVFISNPTQKYIFVSYQFHFPEGWGENNDEIIFIGPKETIIQTQKLSFDPWEAKSNTEYLVPYIISIMGEKTQRTIDYNPQNQFLSQNDDFFCLSAYLLVVPLFLISFFKPAFWY